MKRLGSHPIRKRKPVFEHASGTFETDLKPQTLADSEADAALGRLSITKQFHGDLSGASKGEMLSARTSVETSAGYVAIEKVAGTLHGRQGTFVLQHSSTLNRGESEQSITVVPDSGTGELAGLKGTYDCTGEWGRAQVRPRVQLYRGQQGDSVSSLEAAKTFLLSNGRLLERHLFAYLFEDGSRAKVINALKAYQNEDGGFGNALEPDKRTPSSQPIDQESALRILDDVGLNGAVVEGLCDYLTTITTEEGGVPFTLKTVQDAPHAPWWNTDEANPPASLNPTASIAGLLHKHKHVHRWLDRATAFCWEKLESLGELEVHTLLSVVVFLEYAPDQNRTEAVFANLREQILNATALELDAEGYVHPPYAFAPTPNSLARQLYSDELMDKHLNALKAKQQDDGGWTIDWEAVSPGCELEYRGVVTLNALKMLRAYGHL